MSEKQSLTEKYVEVGGGNVRHGTFGWRLPEKAVMLPLGIAAQMHAARAMPIFPVHSL